MNLDRRSFLLLSMAGLAAPGCQSTPKTVARHNGMPSRTLGKAGEQVSLLCVGGSHIGNYNVSDEESVRIMRTAVDEGVNFFDNAWHYHDGRSERRMGMALKDGY